MTSGTRRPSLRPSLLLAGALLLGAALGAPETPAAQPVPVAAACATSTYVPSMSWVTLRDTKGNTVVVKHSRSRARTVEYSVNGGAVRVLDVEDAVIAGQRPRLAPGVGLSLVTRNGLEIWGGAVRQARLTKVVLTVCSPWRQVAGPRIGR